jgi:hypothetical protein
MSRAVSLAGWAKRSEPTNVLGQCAVGFCGGHGGREARLCPPYAGDDGSYNCPSSVSPPETSTLPGAGSRLSFLTVPLSTSIE